MPTTNSYFSNLPYIAPIGNMLPFSVFSNAAKLLPAFESPTTSDANNFGLDLVGLKNQEGQNQLAALKAIGELQAQAQARKDSHDQALQNRLTGPGQINNPWVNGQFTKDQLQNPELTKAWEQTPAWAKSESLLTPEGMKNALRASNVQNPIAIPDNRAISGINFSPVMENGAQVGNGAWNQAGQLVGYGEGQNKSSFVGPLQEGGMYAPSKQMHNQLAAANAPFANLQSFLNNSQEYAPAKVKPKSIFSFSGLIPSRNPQFANF